MTYNDLVERVRVIVAGDCYGLGEAACRISCECRDRARAALTALEAAGYAVVPVVGPKKIHRDSYLLGMGHLNATAQSFKMHLSIAPEANLGFHDGVVAGYNGLKSTIEETFNKASTEAYWELPQARAMIAAAEAARNV